MLTSLIRRIGIAAPAETVYRSLITEDGIRARWKTDVKMDAGTAGAACLSKPTSRNLKLRQE